MDLDSYYDKGPVVTYNYGFECPLLTHFLSVLEGDFSKEKGTFLFGHNESLFPLLSFLVKISQKLGFSKRETRIWRHKNI